MDSDRLLVRLRRHAAQHTLIPAAMLTYGYLAREVQILTPLRIVAFAAAAFSLVFASSVETRARPLKIIAFGDSLTAGYGLPANEAFPAKLQQALAGKGINVDIVNAGVSGDTTSGGLARLDWSVPSDADAVILELGANDAMRGVDPAITRKALDEMLQHLKQRGIPVLLCGMYAPPNMGDEFEQAYRDMYPALAQRYGALLYPFFLDQVAGRAELNQADSIHPTAKGVDRVVEGILPKVEELIAKAKAGS
jgi:acyl-CoA thioesterase I